MSLLRRSVERRLMSVDGQVGWNDPAAIPPNSAMMRHAAGVAVNERTALQVAAVYACVRLLSESVGGLPLEQFRRAGDGRRTQIDPAPLVADPFAGLEPHEGFAVQMVSCLLRGNSYAHVVDRDYLGVPTSLLVLHPDTIKVSRKDGRPAYTDRTTNKPIPGQDLIHVRGMTLPGALVGLDPIQYFAQIFGLALGAEEFGARFFAQGAHPGGVLRTEQRLTKAQARALAQTLQNRHGGLAQSHLPLVLEGGLEWQPISITPEEAQFLATRAYQRQDVAMIYGIPPHMIGDVDRTTSWGKGIEEQVLGFLSFTLRNWMIRFEAAWSRQLPRGQFVRFNAGELLRTNILARYQTYAIARTIGMLSNDEIRAEEGRGPIPHGDGASYTAPLNSAHNGSVSLAVGGGGSDGSSSGAGAGNSG